MTETTDQRLSARMMHPRRRPRRPKVSLCLGDRLETIDEESCGASVKSDTASMDMETPAGHGSVLPLQHQATSVKVDSTVLPLQHQATSVKMDSTVLPLQQATSVEMDSTVLPLQHQATSVEMDSTVLPLQHQGTSVEMDSTVLPLQHQGTSVKMDSTVLPHQQACMAAASGSSALPKAQSKAGGQVGPRKEVLRALKQCVGHIHQDVQRHLDLATTTSDLQAQETLDEEESSTEHQGRLQSVLAWLRRFGKALKTLRKRGRTTSQVGPGAEEPCQAAQELCEPEVPEADGCVPSLYMRAVDLWQLRSLQRFLQEMDRVIHVKQIPLNVDSDFLRTRKWVMQEIHTLMNKIKETEHLSPIPGNGFINPIRFLSRPANRDSETLSGNAAESEEVLDEKEDRRRRKEILKRIKPKNLSFKRRFSLWLRCLT